jgi:transposase InsO family protein
VNCVPQLLAGNRYNVLAIHEIYDEPYTLQPIPIQATPPTTSRTSKRPKWERRLPKRFTIAAAESKQSLHLSVELETTDTAERRSVQALLDSGATGCFIDRDYVRKNKLNTRPLSQPIPVYNVDGTRNEAGSITEVLDITMRYKSHSERAILAVTSLGRQDMLLGLPWLREHNPEVDWRTGEVKMTRCLHGRCTQCREDQRTRRRETKAYIRALTKSREGPLPACSDEEEDDAECPPITGFMSAASEEEDGRIWATVIHPEPQTIAAVATTSQRLAEAHYRTTQLSQTSAKSSSFEGVVPAHLHEYSEVFAKESFDSLPQERPWDHAIELIPGATPTGCKVYPLSPVEQTELDAFIQENLSTGRIRPSKSPMASPVFFIKKKDGSLRLVQDYRALNAITVKNKYPLPLISELVSKLQGAKYFTKLDIRWGYNNVRIKKGDEWKAAFRTNRGLFEPLVMFFGLTNSPATFQTMMDDIFRELVAEGVVVVYLDDILIFTRTLEEHREVTRRVLDLLRQHKLYLRPEKCEFERTSVEYLGLVISHDTVAMDPVKVAGVQNWPQPTSKLELQSFLGFVNFYRRFIQDFSHHARPLFNLTKADASWKWGTAEEDAFSKLKELITSAPVLESPDPSTPFRIEADSSDFATGAVLSQPSSFDGKWHPVAFYSKSLDAVQRNYEIHDKEMLAIIRALEEWRHFLEGAQHPFEIWTDHRNLEYFMTARKLNRRQARWSLVLARFDFKMHHRPGRSMGKADALSRRADHGSGAKDNEDIILLSPERLAIRALEGLKVTGEEQVLLKDIRRGNSQGMQEEAIAKAAKALRATSSKHMRSSEWSEVDGLLLFRGKIYVPNDMDLRRRIVALHHDSPLAGHAGRWKTVELVSRNYWWPQMSRFIGQYVATCDPCLRTKPLRQLPIGELQPLPIPEARWDTVSVDFIVELPPSAGYDAVMTVVDSVSKRAHFIPTHTTVTAEGSARLFLHNVWKLHGLPNQVISDRGPQFVAEFTRELYKKLGIKIAATTAWHPQADGQTERVNQELDQFLRIFVNERQDNWLDLLPLAEFQHNNHIHASTQHSPFLLDTGRHPRMGFEPRQRPSHLETVNEFTERMKSTLEEAKAALAKAKDDMARFYNQKRLPTPIYKPGDKVYLDASDIQTTRPSKKLSHLRLGPYVVERQVNSHAYKLRLPQSMRRLHPVFNVVKLIPAPEDPFPGRKLAPPPPPVIVDGEEEWEVEEILDSRLVGRKLKFLIKWKGFGREHNSWEDAADVHAPELVQNFYRHHPGAPRFIRTIQFDSIPFRSVPAITSSRCDLEGGVNVRERPRSPQGAPIISVNSRNIPVTLTRPSAAFTLP